VSDPIAVVPGTTYGVMADVNGAGGKVIVEQLTSAGLVMHALAQVLSAVNTGSFTTLDDVVAVGSGVSYVRVRLEGDLLGTSSFDDIRLWKQ
jgi:hypothetical protein